jgi:hypothetical protein
VHQFHKRMLRRWTEVDYKSRLAQIAHPVND